MLTGQLNHKTYFQKEYLPLELVNDEQLGECQVLCKSGGSDKVFLKQYSAESKQKLK